MSVILMKIMSNTYFSDFRDVSSEHLKLFVDPRALPVSALTNVFVDHQGAPSEHLDKCIRGPSMY